MINKYIPTIIKLETYVVNALRQWNLKYYKGTIFIAEHNLSIDLNDHSFPDICLYEKFCLLSSI